MDKKISRLPTELVNAPLWKLRLALGVINHSKEILESKNNIERVKEYRVDQINHN